ncbi:hypothetical protein ACU52_14190 [Xylanibacter rarus]|uniref:Uncharacterized protein n=1 Tax=Xylanibacter rarus TaxID=1676614 RepID=A0A8E1QVN0_9BACT|nr:hypothetical protein ACU52_14190 [Xylanibacter rarus]
MAARAPQWVWGGGRGSDDRSVVVDKGCLPPAIVATSSPQRVWGGGRGSDDRSVVVDKGRLLPASVAARAPQWGRSGEQCAFMRGGVGGRRAPRGFRKTYLVRRRQCLLRCLCSRMFCASAQIMARNNLRNFAEHVAEMRER